MRSPGHSPAAGHGPGAGAGGIQAAPPALVPPRPAPVPAELAASVPARGGWRWDEHRAGDGRGLWACVQRPFPGEWRPRAGSERGCQLRRQLKGLQRRAGKDGGDRRGTLELGHQRSGGEGKGAGNATLGSRSAQRRRGETGWGDRLTAGAREGRGRRAQGDCP